MLISLFVHECLKTEFVIGADNPPYNNWWKEVITAATRTPYPSGRTGHRWVDSIIYTGQKHDDKMEEWNAIDKIHWNGGRTWMSLHDDMERLPELFRSARGMFRDIWVFPGAEDEVSYYNCDAFLSRLRTLGHEAARNGYLVPKWQCIPVKVPCKGAKVDVIG